MGSEQIPTLWQLRILLGLFRVILGEGPQLIVEPILEVRKEVMLQQLDGCRPLLRIQAETLTRKRNARVVGEAFKSRLETRAEVVVCVLGEG